MLTDIVKRKYDGIGRTDCYFQKMIKILHVKIKSNGSDNTHAYELDDGYQTSVSLLLH